ncbi:MAG: prolyl oligopeptidase family serine peptidase [Muribaculaceae bacterium]|nr:prolyl oligopeptidase family serine peptidase [Muribaculaceae bacterium]
MEGRKNLFLIPFLSLSIPFSIESEAKKPLDHTCFDNWKKVTNHCLSNDGKWAAYSVNPQEGDGVLTLRNTVNGKEVNISRGSGVAFTADSRWAIANIKPLFKDTRQAKIDKKKNYEMPQDSLAIIDLKNITVTKIPLVKGFKIGEKGGEWVAYSSCDTTVTKDMKLANKDAGLPMVVRNLSTGESKVYPYIGNYSFSEDGKKLVAVSRSAEDDSIFSNAITVLYLPEGKDFRIDEGKKYYGNPIFSTDGLKLAYTSTNDSNETGTRRMKLWMSKLDSKPSEPATFDLNVKTGNKGPQLQPPHASDPELQEKLMKEWKEKMAKTAPSELFINQYSKPIFSHNGKRLVIGVAPEVAPDDTTLVSFELPELDIWRWDAPYTPPQEKNNLDEIKELTFPVVINLESGDYRLLCSNPLATVKAPDRWDGDWALICDPSKEIVSQQWNYYAPEEISVINVNDGTRKEITTVYEGSAKLSPEARYVFWFKDGNWYTYDISTGNIVNATQNIPFPVWDETDDHPSVRQDYGYASWTEGDSRLLVYDRYDIWSVDPTGKAIPECLTKGYGRDNDLMIRYVNTHGNERRFLKNGDLMTLSLFNYIDKRNGLASMRYGAPAKPDNVYIDTLSFTQIKQALNAPAFSYVEANFSVMPNVWIAPKGVFAKGVQASDSNPQVKDYYWGTARLVRWNAYDGTPSDGVLYVPEDFDPSKKYPMLCVFYETGSEKLYNHFNMEPSWSWVNYPFYVSRGYVIFVPDIHYKAGIPGECAWNFVCSGAEAMCDRYPWIDRNRIGIDGQSWGGYQTAYLVTRTNMFACAGSGAPVSNMTSAFGGIRWESGDSRQAQYEMGQSRIGRNLWEAPELYIANSPVFHANRVETPLLIMHNDADGAVPWYQGIEMFMALRRLQKPVWMLQYNGEAHNLKERRNRKDITVRLQQFFDHYLKGDPMPEWMKNGIPITRKGQELGY